MKYRIYLSSPNMSSSSKELQYIEEAFASNWIAPLGSNFSVFEQQYNQFKSSANAITLTRGTTTISLELRGACFNKGGIILFRCFNWFYDNLFIFLFKWNTTFSNIVDIYEVIGHE